MQFTPETIVTLEPNQIFVFGSNEGGFHGAGAAALAYKKFGAIWGQGDGLQGQCYGISTKDRKIRTLPLHKIQVKIARFLRVAAQHPDKEFLVTKIGCGLAGYTEKEIGSLFKGETIPSNVLLPEAFHKYI